MPLPIALPPLGGSCQGSGQPPAMASQPWLVSLWDAAVAGYSRRREPRLNCGDVAAMRSLFNGASALGGLLSRHRCGLADIASLAPCRGIAAVGVLLPQHRCRGRPPSLASLSRPPPAIVWSLWGASCHLPPLHQASPHDASRRGAAAAGGTPTSSSSREASSRGIAAVEAAMPSQGGPSRAASRCERPGLPPHRPSTAASPLPSCGLAHSSHGCVPAGVLRPCPQCRPPSIPQPRLRQCPRRRPAAWSTAASPRCCHTASSTAAAPLASQDLVRPPCRRPPASSTAGFAHTAVSPAAVPRLVHDSVLAAVLQPRP